MTIRQTFTEAIKKKIAAQRWMCSMCDELLVSTYQVDHTVPLWAGGEDSSDNATAMCVSCHKFDEKGVGLPDDGKPPNQWQAYDLNLQITLIP